MNKVSIGELKPYELNAKKHPKKQIQQVANSIKAFGFNQPIVVDKDNVVIVGHGRLEAAKLLGLKEVPVLKVDLTDDQAKAYRLADNKLNESEWDMKLVIEELKDLSEPMLDLTGFEKDLIVEPEEKDDEVPDVPEEPKSKLGDIYQLGEHRLMCGDSTSLEAVEKLMDGQKADMVFTDPPYGMKKEKDGVLNDNLNYAKLLEFNKEWIALSFAYLKDNGSWYCWGIDEPLMDIYSSIIKPAVKENEVTFRNLITWDKGNGQGQLAEEFRMYPTADEKCLFIMLGVQGFNTNADNYYEAWTPIVKYLDEQRKLMGWTIKDTKRIAGHSENSGCHWFDKSQWSIPTEETYNLWREEAFKKEYGAFKKEYEEIKKEYEEIKKEYYSTRAYFNNTHDNMNNVWHFDRTGQAERVGTGEHATPKPLALCSRGIKTSSREGEVVLDLFGGSGSTLIAAEKLNRKCYMMELDPKYIDVIIERWETYTGNKAIKL
jgi:DNA modification methylase